MRRIDDKVKFRSGVELNNRIVLAPMMTSSGSVGGFATDDTIEYYSTRSKAAGLLITEFHYVSKSGGPCLKNGDIEQLGVYSDNHIESISKIAEALKKDGNKAVLQIHHGGRRAKNADSNIVYAPSVTKASFEDYIVEELSEEHINKIIKDFGEATKRAIKAGFDGVEIHGANHYLLQQFFSSETNKRSDEWGGSLKKRMKFALEVVKEVKRIVNEYAKKDFLIGYRITPEEIHDDSIGYTYKESIELVKEIIKYDIDYIHLSLWNGYNSRPSDSDLTYAELFKREMDDDTKLIIVGKVFNEISAVDAIENFADLIAVGRGIIIDPLFADKIMNKKGNEIVDSISEEQLKISKLPIGMIKSFMKSTTLPHLNGIETLNKYDN